MSNNEDISGSAQSLVDFDMLAGKYNVKEKAINCFETADVI
jgi:hypothetical protein